MNAIGVGAGLRRPSQAEVERLVSEYSQGGLGRKESCATHVPSVHTLDAWRRLSMEKRQPCGDLSQSPLFQRHPYNNANSLYGGHLLCRYLQRAKLLARIVTSDTHDTQSPTHCIGKSHDSVCFHHLTRWKSLFRFPRRNVSQFGIRAPRGLHNRGTHSAIPLNEGKLSLQFSFE